VQWVLNLIEVDSSLEHNQQFFWILNVLYLIIFLIFFLQNYEHWEHYVSHLLQLISQEDRDRSSADGMTFALRVLWVKSTLSGHLSSCFKLTENTGMIGLWPLTMFYVSTCEAERYGGKNDSLDYRQYSF
jgi:hypothetical protein